MSDKKPTPIQQARAELVKMGLIVNSGKRRNGQIVWIAVPENNTEQRALRVCAGIVPTTMRENGSAKYIF